MALDPFLATKLPLLMGLDNSAYTDPVGRASLRSFAQDPAAWEPPAAVRWIDMNVPGSHGAVPIRVYTGSTSPTRLVMWVHGGGFWSGDLDMNEAHMVSMELADRTGCTVVSVGYRLARGGVRFPVPLDDVRAAWRWATSELMPTAASAVLGGASAGAALALATAIEARRDEARRPDRLLLAYPFAHYPNPAPDDVLNELLAPLPRILRFTGRDVDEMVENYVGRIWCVDRLALPGAADLADLPPTTVLVSEIDDLRPSGELLVRQLLAAGGTAELHVCAGMPHGHLNRTPGLPEVDRTLAVMASRITQTHSSRISAADGA